MAATIDERGASGTVIQGGVIWGEEPNDRLKHTGTYGSDAYGSPTQVGIYQQMEMTDPTVGAVLSSAADAICGLSWTVKAHEDDKAPDAQEVAEFTYRALDELQGGFRGTLRRIVRGAMRDGFRLLECPWRRDRSTGKILWRRWADRLPKTIGQWYLGPNEELELVRQYTWKNNTYTTVDLKTAEVDLLHFALRQEGANLQGISLIRAAYAPWLMKQDVLTADRINMRRFGTGIVEATAPEGGFVSKKDETNLIAMCKRIQMSDQGYILKPFGSTLDFKFPSGDMPDITSRLHYYDRQILMCLLAQVLSLGADTTGSRAVGDVQDDIHLRALQGIVTLVEDVINGRGYPGTLAPIRKLIDVNYGPRAYYPYLKLGDLRGAAPGTFVERVAAARQAGILAVWTQNDENEARQRLELPTLPKGMPYPGDEIPPDTPPGAEGGGGEPGAGGDAAGDGADEGSDDAAPPDDAPEGKGEPTPDSANNARRAPSCGCAAASPELRDVVDGDGRIFWARRDLLPIERFAALADIEETLDSARDRFDPVVRPVQERQADAFSREAQPIIEKWGEEPRGGDLTDLQRRIERIKLQYGDEVEEAIRGHLTQHGERIYSATQRELVRASRQPKTPQPAGTKPVNPQTVAAQVKDLDRFEATKARELARKLDSELLLSLRAEALRQAMQYRDVREVAGGIRQVVEAKSTSSYRRVWYLAGTDLLSVTRDRAVRDYADQTGEVVRRCTYSAIMDRDTCENCEGRDGEEFEFGGTEYYEWWPGKNDCLGGSSCRCIYAFDMGRPEE